MPTYYVDPAAGGLNDGSTWTNAWVSLQSAVQAPVVAGDTVYCKGTQTVSGGGWGALTGINGTNADRIKFIGCNAAGTAYAGQFTLQGNGGNLPARLLYVNGNDYLSFYNITFSGASIDCCILENNSNYNWFTHCIFSNAATGFNTNATIANLSLCNCIFKNNTSHGATLNVTTSGCTIVACSSYSNTGYGFNIIGGASISDCCAWKNGDDNYRITSEVYMSGCQGHASTAGSGLQIADAAIAGKVIFCRFTNNNQYGIEVVGSKDTGILFDYNAFYQNGVASTLNTDPGVHDVNLAADGYVNAASDNYSLSGTAEQRRVEIDIDWS